MKSKGKNLKSSVREILEFIGKFIKVKDEKSMSLSSMEVIGYYAILEKTYEFNSSISDHEKSSIIKQAVYDSIRNGVLDEKSFTKFFNKRHSEMLQSNVSSFRVITQFSLSRDLLPETLQFNINGTKIKLLRSIPKVYRKSRKKQEQEIQQGYGLKTVSDNIYCISYVTARSPQEAHHKAFNCIEMLRATLNYCYNLNKKHIMRSYGPVNFIIAGPVHTVHNSSGRVFPELTHREPEYNAQIRSITNIPDTSVFLKNIRHIVNKVNTLKIGGWIGKGLTMYVEALDISNPKLSFTMLWSVLDYFAVSNDSHSNTVNKASSIWKQHELVKSILLVLREVRNDFVHNGISSNTSSDYLEILRGILDKVILFLINIPKQLDDLKALEQYLDLPSSGVGLTNKLSTVKEQSALIKLKLNRQ